MIEILRSERSSGPHVRAAVKHLYGVEDKAVDLGEDQARLSTSEATMGKGRRFTSQERASIFEAVRARDASSGTLLPVRELAEQHGCSVRTIALHRAAIVKAEELIAEQVALPLRADRGALSAFNIIRSRKFADYEVTLNAARALCLLKRDRPPDSRAPVMSVPEPKKRRTALLSVLAAAKSDPRSIAMLSTKNDATIAQPSSYGSSSTEAISEPATGYLDHAVRLVRHFLGGT